MMQFVVNGHCFVEITFYFEIIGIFLNSLVKESLILLLMIFKSNEESKTIQVDEYFSQALCFYILASC